MTFGRNAKGFLVWTAWVTAAGGMGCEGSVNDLFDDSTSDSTDDSASDTGFDSASDTGLDSANGSDADSETESDMVPDVITGATVGVESALLKSSHKGWGQMDCYSCHVQDHVHNYVIGDCVSCHGKNGAPTRPEGHADSGCKDCHGSPHDPTKADYDESCRACHGLEAASNEECAYEETYDAIVVGGGGGGLAAAAMLSKSNRVLLVEQHYKTGGCMVAFRRGEYRFEASLHAYDGWGMSYLGALGINSSLTSKKGDIMYRLVFPDMTLDVPADKDAYRDELKVRFQDEAKHLDSLFENFGIVNPSQYEGMNLLDAVMSHGIENERLIAIVTVLSGFLASSPDLLPAVDFMGMWDSFHSMGYYYFEGGSQSITDALEKSILDNGGVIKRHTRANRIVVEENRVTGVHTDDGGCYSAKAVVSNASAKSTFFGLVGKELLPSDLVDEVNRRTPAKSSIAMVFLGVDADYTDLFPGGTHEMFISDGKIQTMDQINEVRCAPEAVSFMLTDYSVVDPTAAPEGKNAIVISADFLDYDCSDEWNWGDSYASYEQYKATLAEVLVRRAEAYLPGLSDHIEVMEVASPKTVEQFTSSDKGSWAGWAFEPNEEHLYTDTVETPIEGLYMAGSWTAGSGQSTALASGISAASAAAEVLNR
jgi:phytoene dehydrogenase-like protein